MIRNRIRNQKERNEFFEAHVLEYFNNDPQRVFTQVAYMQHSYNGSQLSRTHAAARDIVMGGSLLVYYDDMNDLRKAAPGCIDGRLSVYNAWDAYVTRCENAICRIVRHFEVTPENVHEILKSVMYEKFVDHHESDLYVKKTPVSNFVVEAMKNKALLETFVSQLDDGATWYDLPFCHNPNL